MIARLDVKNDHVIKGIHLEGLRKIGSPIDLAKKYYLSGADELLIMDAVASLYNRNNLFEIIEEACLSVFIPVCLGGQELALMTLSGLSTLALIKWLLILLQLKT